MKKILQPTLLAFSMAWSLSAGAQDADLGVLVMAHGGAPEWNQGVLETVAPLTGSHNLEVAFGMADAVSLQEAVTRLEQRGADRIAVVRLFISGESWYARTEQILGMREGAPARAEAAGHPEHMAADAHAGHGATANQTPMQATATPLTAVPVPRAPQQPPTPTPDTPWRPRSPQLPPPWGTAWSSGASTPMPNLR